MTTETCVATDFHRRADELLARESWGMLIGGKIVPAVGGESYEDYSPADGRRLASIPLAQPEDAHRSIAAAKQALPEWRAMPLAERGARLDKIIATLRAHATELGILDALDSGNPAAHMIAEVGMAADWLQWCRGAAQRVVGETLPAPQGYWLITRREPYGVVVRITAYNHPILFAAQKLGAPLMTGNTLVLKVPEQTPLAPLRLGELLAGIVPPGVVNIITGTGPVAGDALVRHPDVKRISVIGSVRTGQRIQIAAAESGIKHVSLELGGKNPMIVLPDIDVDTTASAAIRGSNFIKSAGQSCGSCSRIFVHEDQADEVVERLVELCSEIRVGDPLDAATDMGCMVSSREQERVLAMIEVARSEGARLACGGGVPPHLMGGAFVEPTVFDAVTPAMAIGRDEVFGPVLSVIRYREVESALEQANSLPLGLTASVWTRDLPKALAVAERFDSGYVWINDAARHFDGAPFSGHRNSGTDSDEGIDELVGFTQVKTISIGVSL